MIAPFTLRRLKSSVLTELPEKIEDIRYCRLTGTPVRLYREAVNDRGGGSAALKKRMRISLTSTFLLY